jgi:hypothetical protein
MSFAIQIIDQALPYDHFEESGVYGFIKIDDFEENFLLSLTCWRYEDYIEQWGVALNRIIEKENSCLITSMRNIKNGGTFIDTWVLYRKNEIVFIQNRIILPDSSKKEIGEVFPYSLILPRETVSEDGSKISEWQTTVEDIAIFLKENNWIIK